MEVKRKTIYPVLNTKFTTQNKPEFILFAKNIEVQMEAGVDTLISSSTQGESSVLTTWEKEKPIKFAIKKVGRKIPAILNISEGGTQKILVKVKYTKERGTEGIKTLPPMHLQSRPVHYYLQ